MKKKNILFIVSMVHVIFLAGMDSEDTYSPKLSNDTHLNHSVVVNVSSSATPISSVPSLNLSPVTRAQSRRPIGSATTQRKTVKNQTQVSDLKRAKSIYQEREKQDITQRSARKTPGNSKRGENITLRGKTIISNNDQENVPQDYTSAIADLMKDIHDETYTEEDLWDFLQIINPVLHDFAVKKGLSLSDTKAYGRALQDFNIKPNALVIHLKNANGFKNNSVDQFEREEYKNIQNKDSRKYKMLLLDLIDQLWTAEDNTETNAPGSLIQNTHLGIQAEQIANQKSDIFYRTVGFACSVLVAFGTSAWGIYGQATGTNHTG